MSPARYLLLFAAFLTELLSPSARGDAIVVSQAMFASTIAEYFVEEDQIRVELEIGAADLATFRNLLPDGVHSDMGFGEAPLEQRLAEFFSRDLAILAQGEALQGFVVRMGPETRITRDPVTGEPLPPDEEEPEVVPEGVMEQIESAPETPAERLNKLKATIEAEIGQQCGLEDLYQDSLWDYRVSRLSKIGALFQLGNFMLAYIDRGDAYFVGVERTHDIVEIDAGDAPVFGDHDAEALGARESAAADRIFGWPHEALINQPFIKVVPDDQHAFGEPENQTSDSIGPAHIGYFQQVLDDHGQPGHENQHPCEHRGSTRTEQSLHRSHFTLSTRTYSYLSSFSTV